MIRYIQIENFKSLKCVAIPIEGLNLFFGMNGMGKSSIIQALLLLRQSYWENSVKGLQGLKINGELTSLGTSIEILSQNAEEERIRFLVQFDKGKKVDVSYSFIGQSQPTGVLKILDIGSSQIEFAENEPLFGKGFSYLGADHISPQTGYNAVQWDRDGINPFGGHGEFVVPFLAKEGNSFRVPQELCLDTGKTDRLYDQVSAWMSEISPGIKISAHYLPFEEQAKLDISYVGQRIESSTFSPINVGFGIPYVLPLIIELLTSDKNGILIFENPESHLHPKGQTRIAELITRVANRGTQIMCESHSDHIINGIRVAVKKKTIPCEKISVVYFEKDDNQNTRTDEIAIDSNGNLSDYPDGLLDEWGLQMSMLL